MESMNPTRRALLATIGGAATVSLAGCSDNEEDPDANPQNQSSVQQLLNGATLYMGAESTSHDYVTFLEEQGDVTLTVAENADLDGLYEKYNVPGYVNSHHLIETDRYIIVGYVPIQAIGRLAIEKPNVEGIGLPGAPDGAPGLPGETDGQLTVYSFKNGGYKEYMRV